MLQQFLGGETPGFFQHGEIRPDLSSVANLLNCALDPELVNNYARELEGAFGKSPYFKVPTFNTYARVPTKNLEGISGKMLNPALPDIRPNPSF